MKNLIVFLFLTACTADKGIPFEEIKTGAVYQLKSGDKYITIEEVQVITKNAFAVQVVDTRKDTVWLPVDDFSSEEPYRTFIQEIK